MSYIYSTCYKCKRTVWIRRPNNDKYARSLIGRASRGRAVCKICEPESLWKRVNYND